MTFTRVLVMVAITAAAVYLGLNFLLPKHAKEATAEGVTSDQVFGSTAAPAGAPAAASGDAVPTTPVPAPPEQGGEAAKPEATATAEAAAPAPAAPAAEAATTPVPAPVETAAAEPAPAAAAPAPAPAAESSSSGSTSALDELNKEKAPVAVDQPLSPEEARKIAEAVRKGASAAPATAAAPAAEPAPAPAAAPAAAPAGDGLSDEEARKIAENVSREVATRVAESSAPASATSSSGSTALSEADVRRIAAEVARQVMAEKRGTQHSAAPAETASAPAPKPAHSHKSASASSSPAPAAPSGSYAKYKTLPSDALHAWWPTGQQPADQLNLLFAGQASTEKAIVLSFNSDMAPASVGGHIKLLDSKGASPKGTWAAGNNGRVIVYKVSKPGRYTLVLNPDLADAGGKTLGKSLHGPVYVQ